MCIRDSILHHVMLSRLPKFTKLKGLHNCCRTRLKRIQYVSFSLIGPCIFRGTCIAKTSSVSSVFPITAKVYIHRYLKGLLLLLRILFHILPVLYCIVLTLILRCDERNIHTMTIKIRIYCNLYTY